jgi:predicted DCC family thiol-disulfide oxidoreductase YuxK
MYSKKHLPSKIIFFDGVCNLCNSSVVWVLKNERKSDIYFAHLQGKLAKQLLNQQAENLDSFVFYETGEIFTKSTAALKLTKYLKWYFQLFRIFFLVPPFIRNVVYDYVAKNRYAWFGKKDQCMMPTAELKTRFLD